MSERSRTRRYWAVAIAAPIVLATAATCWRLTGDRLPGPGSDTCRETVSAFSTGVVALDVDTKDRAEVNSTRAAELVPEKPAPWANRGLLRIRLGDFEVAAADLGRAREQSPGSTAVERLLGLPERQCWRDLIGFSTWYGDVLELLAGVDDRYIIANAGDVLLMRFPASPRRGRGGCATS